ncbi:flagellar biosynthesis protein FlhF [Noviherbaspirillum massiliense]|uniref:flagellar biosynthesis protein FlhF n=1 Tax=Noviherbaspirillum massiliense TaxID=1465823 RepID=UPI00031E3368|nr:flagellar biosynthesis protein FlhF [Noviherbaspirillum massiliense]
MNVKKFTANTSREAWRLVREALGPDAVILSNRTVNGAVEILALAGDDVSSLAEPAVEKEALPKTAPNLFAPERVHNVPAAAQAEKFDAVQAREREISLQELNAMMGEIRSMRGMLESQLAEIAWGTQQKREPFKAVILREMLAAGFSASLARYLLEKLPANEKPENSIKWVKSVLSRNIGVMENENEILDKGGVYALVGPTGVGKTTTTAKLAARCVMRHGAGKLALITTDGYRIGGYEQLRIYGKILGVMVHSVKDETDLRIALDELKNKHTVLIDTVGVGQRDRMVAEQVAMLQGAGTKVKRLLCLSATSTGETLNEVVRAYQGDGLAGAIITKLDEAATIGSALDVVIRQKLNLYYVANGQRVPEDLHLANRHYLIDRAFKLKRETAPFRFQEDELPVVIANTARTMNDKSLREVSLG